MTIILLKLCSCSVTKSKLSNCTESGALYPLLVRSFINKVSLLSTFSWSLCVLMRVFFLKKSAKGLDLMHLVTTQLNISEQEYFGLLWEDKNGEKVRSRKNLHTCSLVHKSFAWSRWPFLVLLPINLALSGNPRLSRITRK